MTSEDRSIVRRSPFPPSLSTPLVSPLQASVVYRSKDADEMDAQYEGREPGFTYAREDHPNARVLADKLAWMEGAEGGVMTASGMAAVSTVFLGLLEAGDHIVAGDQLYGRCLRLLAQELPRLGITATLVPAGDGAALAAAIRPETRLLLVEVVSNPTLRVADITVGAELARRHGLTFAVDNTFTTPRGFQPFDHGADVVIHSVTKLLAGHSDATLGFVAARAPEQRQAIAEAVATWGFNASPFDCWLAERGLHTFALRYDQAEANARILAAHLRGQPGVEQVLYPGSPDHPDRALVEDLLDPRSGNMLSFVLAGGRPAVNAFLRAARNIPFAPTLGDVATMVSHPASSSHRGLTPDAREALGIPEGMIRVSVGIEDPELLRRDFAEALQAAVA